jgi:FdhD protein
MRIYLQVRSSRVTEVRGTVVAELPLSIYVNGERLVTLLCSPFQVDALVVGHLWMERIIGAIDDIVRLDVSEVDGRADVELTGPLPAPSARPARPEALHSALRVRPAVVSARIAELAEASVHYKESRGIHSAALGDEHGLLLVTEDVARRNALDKLKGRALLEGIPTHDRLLVSSGRISSELLLRAARMGVPFVASRTSPTDMAIALAEALNITVCGYVRPDGLNLYVGDGLILDRASTRS